MVDSWKELRALALAIVSVDGSGRQGRRRYQLDSEPWTRKVKEAHNLSVLRRHGEERGEGNECLEYLGYLRITLT